MAASAHRKPIYYPYPLCRSFEKAVPLCRAQINNDRTRKHT